MSDRIRLIILQNHQTPATILAKVSRSTSWLERYAIVQNPNTPIPIVQRLAEDANHFVRAAVKTRLETEI